MDEAGLAQLAESIRAQGVMQPVLVRPVASGRYEIIAGERRWRAAKLAGMTDIPAVVREVADEAALVMALIENIQRENLNPIEEAAGIQRLIDEFSMTHEQAAQAVGRSRSAVRISCRLLSLADRVQELILGGSLDMGHGRALLALSRATQVETAQTVAAKQLSVRETERLVARLLRTRAHRTTGKSRWRRCAPRGRNLSEHRHYCFHPPRCEEGVREADYRLQRAGSVGDDPRTPALTRTLGRKAIALTAKARRS